MKLLLDTHIVIWLATEPDMLSPRTRALCQDLDNELLLSIASIWEMQIKHQLGKLAFITPLAELITRQREVNRVALLSVEPAHIFALQDLPPLHKDPLIAC